MRRNGRDAPIPAVRCAPTERVKSTHLSRSLPRDQVRLYDPGSAVQAHNSGRVPSRHKQGSEFQRWAAVNRRLRLPRLAILSRAGLRPAGAKPRDTRAVLL